MKQIIAATFLCLLILFPQLCVEGAKQGLILWGLTLVPTLLPFFIATRYILQWNIHPRLLFPYLLFIGYFCGYPTGASVIDQLFSVNTFTKKQAELLVCLCNHTSPAFLISFVYYTYFTRHLSLISFLFPIYFSAILWSIIFCFFFHRPPFFFSDSCMKKSTIPSKNLESIFIDSVYTIVKIGCFMVIFSILINCSLSFFGSVSPLCSISSCFLEITSGLHFLSSFPISFHTKKALMEALCSFGGCCSIAQVQGVLHKELSTIPFILFKICTGMTTFLLCYLAG